MAIFTLGSFAASATANLRGQGFTPNVAGPDGTGSCGTANPVFLKTFSLGYATSDTSGRADYAYLYSAIPTSTDLNNSGYGCIAVGGSPADGNVFGGSNHSRTWTFDDISIDPAATYYVLFASNQLARYKATDNYAGGELVQSNVTPNTNRDTQFEVVLSDTDQ